METKYEIFIWEDDVHGVAKYGRMEAASHSNLKFMVMIFNLEKSDRVFLHPCSAVWVLSTS